MMTPMSVMEVTATIKTETYLVNRKKYCIPGKLVLSLAWMLIFTIQVGISQKKSLWSVEMDSLVAILKSGQEDSIISLQTDAFIRSLEKREVDSMGYLYSRYGYWLRYRDRAKAIEFQEKSVAWAALEAPEDIQFNQACLINLGLSRNRNGDTLTAIEHFKELIELDPQSSLATTTYNQLRLAYF